MSIIGTRASEWALHDTNTTTEIVGFVPSASGTIEVIFRKDTAAVTLQVVAGTFYPFDIEVFKSSSSTPQPNLVIVFGSTRSG
jgi:hypothetical protein